MSLHLLLEVITKDHDVPSVVANSARVGATRDVWDLTEELARAKVRKLGTTNEADHFSIADSSPRMFASSTGWRGKARDEPGSLGPGTNTKRELSAMPGYFKMRSPSSSRYSRRSCSEFDPAPPPIDVDVKSPMRMKSVGCTLSRP